VTAARTGSVIALGYACLDHRFWVEQFPPARPRTRATSHRTAIGGPAAVGAVAVVRLGGAASLVARVGDDMEGARLAALLGQEGVDVGHVRAFTGAQTPASAILVTPDGDRHIFAHHGEGLPEADDWVAPDLVERADVVLLDHTWPAGATGLAERARRRGLPVVLDLHRATETAWRLASLATHVIGDQELAAGGGGVERTLAAIRRAGAWGAVTLGAAGIAFDGGHMAAALVQARDTTGAGDVLHGAFALGLAEGRSESEALGFASAAATEHCRQGAVPRRADVDRAVGVRASTETT